MPLLYPPHEIGTLAPKVQMPDLVTASNVGLVNVSVHETPEDGITVVSLTGQLDIDTAGSLSAALDGALHQPVPRIVIDLTEVAFCDSIGLSALAVAYNRCVEVGGFLRVAGANAFLIRVFDVVGLRPALPMFGTVDGARANDPADQLTANPRRSWS